MRTDEIFEDEPNLWRVNSPAFKARRKQLKLSLEACAMALSAFCDARISATKLWRNEKQAHFKVDAMMKKAIEQVLRLKDG